jgi:small-conductance mechanosensitive channel
LTPQNNNSIEFTRKNSDMRWLTICLSVLALLIFVVLTVIGAIYFPQVGVYVPIIALGLALALQKYTASFIAYFVITFSKIYDIGDRIRIANFKGDVRRIGVLHTTLEEVGEDEKLGGELTGRLLHFPNLILLDQPVLNYSKDYSVHYTTISSDYMFDEVRIPLTPNSNIEKAIQLLEEALSKKDDSYIQEAQRIFQNGYPRFLNEAISGPRVQIHIEPGHIWIQGKFVAPLKGRNELRSQIFKEFILKIKDDHEISLC